MLESSLIDQVKRWLLQEYDLDDFMYVSALKEVFPNKLNQKKPSFLIPQKIKEAEILLFTQSEDPNECALLRRMSEAIDKHIAKAFLLEMDHKRPECWFQTLFDEAKKARWILISELELYQMPDLMSFYERGPRRTLNQIPLFLLADLKAYQADPELKKSLWKTLLGQL